MILPKIEILMYLRYNKNQWGDVICTEQKK